MNCLIYLGFVTRLITCYSNKYPNKCCSYTLTSSVSDVIKPENTFILSRYPISDEWKIHLRLKSDSQTHSRTIFHDRASLNYLTTYLDDFFDELRRSNTHSKLKKLEVNRFTILKIFDKLSRNLVDKDVEVKLVLLAILSHEHILLLGPPGTGKSELGRRLATIVKSNPADHVYFERLLTKYTNPEELFGPLSLSSLERDKYIRNTEGYLSTASIAFLDEIFKANSAILNSLLTILNERKFDNGNERLDVPLMAVVGASNELPDSEELDALYDRFLFRRQVSPISDDGVMELLMSRNYDNSPATDISNKSTIYEDYLSQDMIQEIHHLATNITAPDYIIDLLIQIRSELSTKYSPSIYISDRRLLKAMKVLRILAVTQGRNEVNILDCMILPYIFNYQPTDENKIRQSICDNICDLTLTPIQHAIINIKNTRYPLTIELKRLLESEFYTKWTEYSSILRSSRKLILEKVCLLEKIIYELRVHMGFITTDNQLTSFLNQSEVQVYIKSMNRQSRFYKNPSAYAHIWISQYDSILLYTHIKEKYEVLIPQIKEILCEIHECYWWAACDCIRLKYDENILFQGDEENVLLQ